MDRKEKLERLLDEIVTSDPYESASMAKEIYELYIRLRADKLAKDRTGKREQPEIQTDSGVSTDDE